MIKQGDAVQQKRRASKPRRKAMEKITKAEGTIMKKNLSDAFDVGKFTRLNRSYI